MSEWQWLLVDGHSHSAAPERSFKIHRSGFKSSMREVPGVGVNEIYDSEISFGQTEGLRCCAFWVRRCGTQAKRIHANVETSSRSRTRGTSVRSSFAMLSLNRPASSASCLSHAVKRVFQNSAIPHGRLSPTPDLSGNRKSSSQYLNGRFLRLSGPTAFLARFAIHSPAK